MFLCFLLSPNSGQMLKRKLQVSPSSYSPENPVRDKWTQQPNPSEDGCCCSCPADAADDPWTEYAACGEILGMILQLSSSFYFYL